MDCVPVIKKSISLILNLTHYFAIMWFSPNMETLVKNSLNKLAKVPLLLICIR